jgi:hypothetical protein
MTYEDLTKVTSREVVWKNRVRWAKQMLVQDKLVTTGWKRGIWKLTVEGYKELHRWGIK